MMQRLTLFLIIVGLLNPASPLLADDAPEIRGVFVDDSSRQHVYLLNQITGKAVRVTPDLSALDFSGGKPISDSNIEQVARDIIASLTAFSGVSDAELVFVSARKTRRGMWIASFEQEHRGLLVYKAHYGVTIGKTKKVLSVGGDFYGVAGFPTEGTVTEHASPIDLGGLDAEGPIGSTGSVFDAPDLRVSPSISSSEVVADLLAGSADAEIIDHPQLMIYPDVSETGVAYKIGWVASVDDGSKSREVVIDAFNGRTLATESLVTSYSRDGKVKGLIHPRHDFQARESRSIENLKVKAFNISGQTVTSDETSSSGRYSMSWSGATGQYNVGTELEGEYVKSVTDEDGDLDHYGAFSSATSETYNWTFASTVPDDLDQINIFYHTNKMARWFEDELTNIRFKVELVSNSDDVRSDAHAHCKGRSTPKIEFSGHRDSERQSDTIYHEYVHAVLYKLHNRWFGNRGSQGRAIDEGMADYFAHSFLNNPTHHLANTSNYRDLNPASVRKYPRDYNNTSSDHERGLIPAGACWDLRLDLGQSDADEIIFAALEMNSPRATTFQRFFDNVLLADDDLNGDGVWTWQGCSAGGNKSPHASEIWDAFGDVHTMPSGLLSEDPDCSSSKRQVEQSADAAIEGAYPNPFNSSVNLRYDLKDSGQVEVAIYSITGQLIRRLVSEHKTRPGTYSVAWDGLSDRGRQVASGIYLVRVQSPGLIQSFKLSLIR